MRLNITGVWLTMICFITRCLGSTAVLALTAIQAMGDPAMLPPLQENPVESYFLHWQDRVREAQDSQPHWMTPLVTVTPRLEQEIRYDLTSQQLGNGARVTSYGNGKGLELIPTTTNELLFNAPPLQTRSGANAASGLGDWPVFTVKQRLISANEEHGNYIVSAFFGVQAPIGDAPFTNHAWIFTPTLAAGKGFGNFDVQGTVGVQVPGSHESTIGTAIVSNIAFQYHLFEYLWPELELNDTAWSGGLRDGRNQLFMTVGVIFGRFQLPGNVRFIFGGGYQFALSPTTVITEPALVPTFDHGPLLTARLAF